MDNLKYCYNVRSGKHINILEFVKDLEDEYRIQLRESINSCDTEYDVSNETFNDYLVALGKFYTLKELGYIEPEEYAAVDTILSKIRLEVLKNSEDVPESAND